MSDLTSTAVNRPHPAEVVQAKVVALDIPRRFTERQCNAKEQLGRRVADSHDARAGMGGDGLSHHARWIGEVDDPGAGGQAPDQAGVFERYRNGAQCHRESARPGGFLPRKTMLEGDPLVAGARFHAANADAADHESAILHRLLDPARGEYLHAAVSRNLLAESRHQFRAREVLIEQKQFPGG